MNYCLQYEGNKSLATLLPIFNKIELTYIISLIWKITGIKLLFTWISMQHFSQKVTKSRLVVSTGWGMGKMGS